MNNVLPLAKQALIANKMLECYTAVDPDAEWEVLPPYIADRFSPITTNRYLVFKNGISFAPITLFAHQTQALGLLNGE